MLAALQPYTLEQGRESSTCHNALMSMMMYKRGDRASQASWMVPSRHHMMGMHVLNDGPSLDISLRVSIGIHLQAI